MNGDSENEEGPTGQKSADLESHPTTGESEGESSFRPFRAWASAYEPQESAWARFRARLASLFQRKKSEPAEDDAGDTPADVTGDQPASEEMSEPEPSVFKMDEEDLAVHARAVAPPNDFRFPFPRVKEEAPAAANASPSLPSQDMSDAADDAFDFDAAFDAAAAPAPASSVPTNFLSEPPPGQQETFESVEDALPAGEPEVRVHDEVEAATKPGLLSRIFRRSKATRQPAQELEIEVHEDRIEAAAHALDEVGAEQFEAFEGAPATPAPAFESVDAALPAEPVETPSLEGLPIIGEFAPDAPADTESQRSTLETEAVDLPESDRTTAEVALASLPVIDDFSPPATVEPPQEPAVFDGESTQEIEKKRTASSDLDVASVEGPTDPMEEPTPTLEVEKKSFWTQSFVGKLFRRGDTEVEKVGAEAEDAARASSAFLLAKFRAFYNEIIKFQHQKSEFTAGFATAIVSEVSSDDSPDAAAEGLSKRLGELLELQAAEAKWMGGEAAERYPEAQYAMAALADEIFAHTEWEGKTAWSKFSLERKLHHSRDAEIELFRRMDRLLKEAPDSDVARDLGRVYLLVLAAGFQGKWRPFELARPIAEYRRRLYEYIYGSDPLMLYAPDRKVFPEAASRTLEGHAVSRFSAAQRWAAILVFLVISYTVVAHFAWNRVSADLKDVTTRIKTGAANGAP